MNRSPVGSAVLVLLLVSFTQVCFAGGAEASVSGVVRDTSGVGQMGALVQVLAANSAVVANVYTDLSGHYRIANLLPGSYQIRARSPLSSSASRNNLQLPGNARAVVDLTLSTIVEAGPWIPAERRHTDEPSDEWKWTLRSAANRPVLRMVDDPAYPSVPSTPDTYPQPVLHASGGVSSGSGEFGLGGLHQHLSLGEVTRGGSNILLRADLGSDSSFAVQTGYERPVGFAGVSEAVATFQSHPEMLTARGAGVQTLLVATAERTTLGDTVDLEYGSLVAAMWADSSTLAARPFVRVLMHPASGWSAGYRMATARGLQSYDAVPSAHPDLPAVGSSGGRWDVEGGVHQEVSLTREADRQMLQIALYRDRIDRTALVGVGRITPNDLAIANESGILVDPATRTFRLMSGGYEAQGLRVTLSQPVTSALSAAVSVATGSGLTRRSQAIQSLQSASSGMKATSAETATVALKGRLVHSGTQLRGTYRWQPRHVLTPVDPYAPFSDQAYLSLYLDQPLHCRGVLPEGLNLVIDVTNLLAQGYQPYLSADGSTLFLAQSPRSIQAGLSYSF